MVSGNGAQVGKDASPLTVNTMPLNFRHWRIVITASAGQVLGSALATLIGVVLPLIDILGHPELAHWERGALASISLIGITFGSLFFGRLSDKFGYLFFFRFCPLLVCGAALGACFFDSVWALAPFLFLMGFGVGGEYSLDLDYISELLPKKWAKFMVAFAKATSALGSIFTALACFLILKKDPSAPVWNDLFLIIAAFTALMFLSRIPFRESPRWLVDHGKIDKAEKALKYFLGPKVELCDEAGNSCGKALGERIETSEIRNRTPKGDAPSIWSFDRNNVRKIILTGIPWACEGVGVYGIGTFMPVLITALGLSAAAGAVPSSELGKVMKLTGSVEMSFWVNCFILPGFLVGLWLIKRISAIKLLVWGFIISSLGLVLLVCSFSFGGPISLMVLGFFIFEFFLNLGPHLMTYVLPSEVFPVADRGEGAGTAAALGKVGAVTCVFLIPVLLNAGGIETVLWFSVGVQLFGALIAWLFGRPYEKTV